MNINRQQTQALKFPRSRRTHGAAVLTSMPAGKMVPVLAMPMLREDALQGAFNVAVEMLETKEILLNPVNLRLTAYVVPWLAFERFNGSREQFDLSWMGEPPFEGEDPVPFFELAEAGTHGSNAVYKYLGLHAGATDTVNTMYLEAYNAIWNFRAKNRSPDLTLRERLTATLAPAFWHHGRFQNIVPDFDQAVIDGKVALDILDPELSLKNKNLVGNLSDENWAKSVLMPHPGDFDSASVGLRNPGSATEGGKRVETFTANESTDGRTLAIRTDLRNIIAELDNDGISVSLANIELARKTQAFARMRERYTQHDEEWIIDMLMSGISIPEQHLKQPILLADQMVRFGQQKRYATDADNLAESAVSGAAGTSLRLRVPRLNTGGVVMVMAEAVPEQLFERQRDPFFYVTNARDGTELRDLPDALRDTLDPEKVDVVKNADVDVLHATPTDPFGYEPMNAKWHRWGPRVGGKFLRPTSGTNTARERIWPVETANPSLSADFYIVSGSLPTNVFLDEASDPFELTLQGAAVIEGNTQFGGLLVEATDNYDKVLEKAPVTRIEKSGD